MSFRSVLEKTVALLHSGIPLLILVELDISVNMAGKWILCFVPIAITDFFMTSGMPLKRCVSVSSDRDFQTFLSCFLFEGTGVLKDKGGIHYYYYFYPLPAPLFFLLPSFHAAVEHLRKTCLPLSKFPTNVNWASGKRKCESWGHSWNKALAWLHIILLLCFRHGLRKKYCIFPTNSIKRNECWWSWGDHKIIKILLCLSGIFSCAFRVCCLDPNRKWGRWD